MAQSRADTIQALKATITSMGQNLQQLKTRLKDLEEEEVQATVLRDTLDSHKAAETPQREPHGMTLAATPLDLEEYRRYGRQMIIPGLGLQGQLKLKYARVLIVGLGGLGSPAAAYLAGAGVGKIGLVDGDTVEVSNLHRQIIHTADSVGMLKVESAARYLKRLNPKTHYLKYPFHLTPVNALSIFRDYDIILDCTDHPTSRYLISDAAVISKKLLVTGSATQTQGQLMVLGNVWNDWPCYRCVFPKPPSPDTVQSCSESGILGPVVGVMGVLMAVEALRTITQYGAYGQQYEWSWIERAAAPTLLLYSAYDIVPFRTTYLKRRRKGCVACSAEGGINRGYLESGQMDYVRFCGVNAPTCLLPSRYRISARDFIVKAQSNQNHIQLIDVREKQDFDMCHLKSSRNLPFSVIERAMQHPEVFLKERNDTNKDDPIWDLFKGAINDDDSRSETYFICRYGNDSQKAAHFFLSDSLAACGWEGVEYCSVMDIEGGLHAWSRIDPTFPDY